MFGSFIDVALACHPVLALVSVRHPKMQARPFNPSLYYLSISFITLLVFRYCSYSYLAIPWGPSLDICTTHDQPNPIASLYPDNATGTLNGTVAVIPIPLTLARKLIPSEYGILEHAYRDLLPSFPKDMYPAVVQALHDHEVQAFGYKIPDFSVSTHCVGEDLSNSISVRALSFLS